MVYLIPRAYLQGLRAHDRSLWAAAATALCPNTHSCTSTRSRLTPPPLPPLPVRIYHTSRFAFNLFDLDGSGSLETDEVAELIMSVYGDAYDTNVRVQRIM